MKGLIKLASLLTITAVLTSCSCCNWFDSCNNPCSTTESHCCPGPHIWEHNNCCDQANYY